MTQAFEYLVKNAHSLYQFNTPGQHPADVLRRMVRRMGTASSGEACLIAAAISLIPPEWLPDDVQAPEFHLSDVYCLDPGNTHALLMAINIAAENT